MTTEISLIDSVAHAPVRDLAAEAGLQLEVDETDRRVLVRR